MDLIYLGLMSLSTPFVVTVTFETFQSFTVTITFENFKSITITITLASITFYYILLQFGVNKFKENDNL